MYENCRFALKFVSILRSAVAEAPVKFHSDGTTLKPRGISLNTVIRILTT